MPGSENRVEDVLLWSVADHPLEIECPRQILEEIHAAVKDALRRLSRGGFETGGVLFGRRDEYFVRVLAWRPIPCDHASGPSFVLSNQDRQSLMTLLEDSARDPQLQVLDIVGWFVSHTRPGLRMTGDDIDLYNRFFPEPTQVTLVVHPGRAKETRAGFFVREADGHIEASQPHAEFSLEGPGQLTIAPNPGHSRQRPTAGEEEPRQPKDSGRFTRLAWLAVTLLLGAFVMLAIPRFQQAPQAPEALQLRIHDVEGQLRIEWDPAGKTVRAADSGALFIDDGGMLPPVRLDAEALRRGMVAYARMSGNVVVRLEVNREDRPPLREQARYVGPPLPALESGKVRQAMERREQLEKEADRMREAIAEETDRAGELKKDIRNLERRKPGW